MRLGADEDFEAGKEQGLVFCLSIKGCGNGLHTECFQQWAAQKKPVHVSLTLLRPQSLIVLSQDLRLLPRPMDR